MLKINSIEISNFRGIVHLVLKPEGQNLGIVGHNGTGKSGVVDAIEFGLTGSISRLSGDGTAGMTVREHGPHVDKRQSPKESWVELEIQTPLLKYPVKVRRSPAAPTKATVIPDNDETKRVIGDIALHPEISLSRRHIIKFVVTTPNERSKRVQELLKVDRVSQIRAALVKQQGSLDRERSAATRSQENAAADLARTAGQKEFVEAKVVEAINERRAILKLAKLEKLEKDAKIYVAASEDGQEQAQQKTIVHNKEVAGKLLKSLGEILADDGSKELAQERDELEQVYSLLSAEKDLIRDLRKQRLINDGLSLLDQGECPLCDEEWEIEKLKAHLKEKQERISKAIILKTRFERASHFHKKAILNLKTVLAGLRGQNLPVETETATKLDSWSAALSLLEKEFDDLDSIFVLKEKLDVGWKQFPKDIDLLLSKLSKVIEALPERSNTESAKEFLIFAQSKFDSYLLQKNLVAESERKLTRATALLEVFERATERILGGLYDAVSSEFSRFYRKINQEDESDFTARLSPADGALELAVDFYKRGQFPPVAYHSEGHQDAMGLCLYLALMRKLHGAGFTLAVLDDVVMSIDSGHRKAICELLRDEFNGTQFVFTTHDEVWLKQMVTSKVISSKSAVRFGRWSVDSGPLIWLEKDVWEAIDEDLKRAAVPTAAHTLRRYLEYISAEICDNLKGKVSYRGDGGYDAGELMAGADSALTNLLDKAAKSAKSFKNAAEEERVKALQEAFKTRKAKSNVEQWAINKQVHYNAWAQMQPKEFGDVVNAFRDLLKSYSCENPQCQALLWREAESLRCDCGAVNLNLLTKES